MLDSGATSHLVNSIDLLDKGSEVDCHVVLSGINGEKDAFVVKKKGNVTLNLGWLSVKLTNVLVSKDAELLLEESSGMKKIVLVGVRPLSRDSGLSTLFEGERVKLYRGKSLVFSADSVSTALYLIEAGSRPVTSNQIHNGFGDIENKATIKVVNKSDGNNSSAKEPNGPAIRLAPEAEKPPNGPEKPASEVENLPTSSANYDDDEGKHDQTTHDHTTVADERLSAKAKLNAKKALLQHKRTHLGRSTILMRALKNAYGFD